MQLPNFFCLFHFGIELRRGNAIKTARYQGIDTSTIKHCIVGKILLDLYTGHRSLG